MTVAVILGPTDESLLSLGNSNSIIDTDFTEPSNTLFEDAMNSQKPQGNTAILALPGRHLSDSTRGVWATCGSPAAALHATIRVGTLNDRRPQKNNGPVDYLGQSTANIEESPAA